MLRFWKRFLDPIDVLAESIYSVLILMTFTMAVRIFDTDIAARPDFAQSWVHSLFVAALGCAIAWGFIDAVIYILTSLAERSQARRFVRSIETADNHAQAVAHVAEMLDSRIGEVTTEAERARLAVSVVKNLAGYHPAETWVKRDDITGALALFSVAIVSTLPVVLPLLLVRDPFVALRVSNLVSVAYLYLIGYWWGKYAGTKPVRAGLMVALTGTILVIVAIPLGG
jgi:VIT1/CCC1 family predicted Fe2+/Mn2+ transporter